MIIVDIDQIISEAEVKIFNAATKEDIVRIRQVLRNLLETTLASAATTQHQQRMKDIGKDSVALCRYYGELGIAESEARSALGRILRDEERLAMQSGAFDRRAEARAIELGQARSGGKVLPWMTSLS
jgi:hypothetical protein